MRDLINAYEIAHPYENGKLAEKQGRKTEGLRITVYGGRVTESGGVLK